MSLLYAVVADSLMVKHLSVSKLNNVLNILASKWLDDSSKFTTYDYSYSTICRVSIIIFYEHYDEEKR